MNLHLIFMGVVLLLGMSVAFGLFCCAVELSRWAAEDEEDYDYE